MYEYGLNYGGWNGLGGFGGGMNPNPTQNITFQSPLTKQELIHVHGKEGAKAYPLAPNSSAALFDETADICWIKVVDGAGFATLKGFALTPYEESTVTQQPIDVKTSEYVTKSEFNALNDKFEKLMEDLNGKPST